MSEMIDRIAKVLCADAGEIGDMPTTYHPAVDFVWQHYRVAARAVLEAMREPTQTMLEEACRTAPHVIITYTKPEERGGAIPLVPVATWRAMIAAALQEKETGE